MTTYDDLPVEQDRAFKLKFEASVIEELNIPQPMGMTEMLQRKAIEYGEARGRSAGKAEEKENLSLAIVNNCIQLGYDNSAIVSITGLSLERVQAIRAQAK